MAMNVEADIRDLKRRVGELEGPYGFSIQPLRGVHRDLLAFQARTEERFQQVGKRFDTVEARLNRLEREGRSLRADLPKVVSNAMPEVLRERREKSPRKR
jgi:hypothetical protein